MNIFFLDKLYNYIYKINFISSLFLFILLLFSFKSYSFNNYNIKNIILDIKDNKDNVNYYINLLFKYKKKFKISEILYFFYKMNHFKKIKVNYLNNKKILIYLLYNPIIYNFKIIGNKLFNYKKIYLYLKKFNINKGNFLSINNLLKFKKFIINKYKSKSKYNNKIFFFKKKIYKNKYLLKIVFKEGNYLNVRNINFFGNFNFSKDIIYSLIKTRIYNSFINFFLDNYFNNMIFINDLKNIKNFYFSKGYFDFNIYKVNVKLIKKKFLDLNIYLNEGNRYKIEDLIIKSSILNYTKKLNIIKNNFFKKNMFYNSKFINKIIKRIHYIFEQNGYANIFIDVKFKKKSNNKLILFLYVNFDKKYYINKILWYGNDKVDLNLFKKKFFFEGKLYNSILINNSLNTLYKSNLFSSIKLNKKFLGINSNKLNLIYNIVENNNGVFSFKLGYGKKSKINYDIRLSKNNFLYKNDNWFISFLKNKINNSGSLLFSYPLNYLYDIYIKNNFFYNFALNNSDYDYLNFFYGIETNFNFLLNDFINYNLFFKYVHNYLYKIKSQLSHIDYFNSINKKFYLETLNNKLYINDFFITNNFIIDKLNSSLFPSKGYYFDFSTMFSIPYISNNDFFKIYLNYYHYFLLNKNLIFNFNSYIGYGNGLNGRRMPFYENYYFNDNIPLRGFDYDKVGPNKIYLNSKSYKCKNNNAFCLSNESYGGNLIFFNSFNIIFPNNFFLGKYFSKYLRTSIFLDSGIILDTNFNYKILKNCKNVLNIYNYRNILRLSAGLAFNIITPIGPLNISFSLPIRYNYNNDEFNFFQFSIG